MLIIGFIGWWYSNGWLEAARRLATHIKKIGREFSIVLLIKTLFAPWKQLVAYSHAQSSLGDKFRRAIDNLISRTVGAIVRLAVFMAGIFYTGFFAVIGLVILIIWPALPVISLWLIIRGLGVGA